MSNESDQSPSAPPSTLPKVKMIAMPAQGPMAMPESGLPDRLRYARSQLDLKIEALSRLTEGYDVDGKGVSPTSISRYEAGENFPGTVELRILCDALGVTAQWLVYGDVPNAGQTESEQQLITAMRDFISTNSTDGMFATNGVRPHLQWVLKATPAQLLENARKPRPRKPK